MKNKLIDLNNHLFEQMERLNDESIKGDDLRDEINRSKAMGSIARTIIDNGRLAFDAHKAVGDGKVVDTPPMLGLENKNAI